MTKALTVSRLPLDEMLLIAEEAGVLKRMSVNRTRKVVVDYVPARMAMAIPRELDDYEPVEVYKPAVVTLSFTLEDAMFGGSIYVALVCGDRVVIHPWVWQSYEHLSTISLKRR